MEKTSKLFLVGILALALVLTLNITSAATSNVFTISNLTYPTSVSENSNTFSFSFDVQYNGSDESRDISFSDSTSTIGSVSIPTATNLNGSINETKRVTGTVTGFQNEGGNSLVVRINATAGNSRDDQTTFTVQIRNEEPDAENFCEFGDVGDLEIADFVINNLGNGDDNEWEPLDRIEIEVEVENTNRDDDIRDVLVEIKIMDGDQDVTNDFDIRDEEIDLGRINDDDSEVAVFEIDEVPADLDEGTYRIFVKAYEDGDEDLNCVATSSDFDNSDNNDLYHEIEFTRTEDVAVIVKDSDLIENNIQASCGDTSVEVTFPIYNIGVDKEDKVLVTLFNRELGVDEKVVVDDLRSGKRKDVTFFMNIPEDLSKDRYSLDIITYFDYDDDEDELDVFAYDSNSDDDLDESYRINLDILNCEIPKPTITAVLTSSAMIGEELVVTSTIRNNADKEADFLVSVSDFSNWAEILSEEVQTITLDAGESEELTIRFNPTESGTQSFKINVVVDGQTFEQSVSLSVSEEEGIFNGINNITLYLIIGIAILVILIIITLIIRLARGSRRREFSDLS